MLGIKTLLGSERHGYFIPSRAARFKSQFGPGTPYSAIEKKFQSRETDMAEWLSIADLYADSLDRIHQDHSISAKWTQDWFPRLDAALLYGFVRHFKPERIVEVGSGHSTRFAQQAIEDEALTTDFASIDPYPRAELPKAENFTWVAASAQNALGDAARALQAGDFLLVDSSHVLMPGSDVDFILNVILPSLPQGVFVQIHDIFLPDDYPPQWDWRAYNEQQAVAAMLTQSTHEIVISSYYITTRMQARFKRTRIAGLPLLKGAHEASLWLRTS